MDWFGLIALDAINFDQVLGCPIERLLLSLQISFLLIPKKPYQISLTDSALSRIRLDLLATVFRILFVEQTCLLNKVIKIFCLNLRLSRTICTANLAF